MAGGVGGMKARNTARAILYGTAVLSRAQAQARATC